MALLVLPHTLLLAFCALVTFVPGRSAVESAASSRRVDPCLALPLALGPTAADRAVDSTVAFVDVTVVPMDRERVLAHYTVLVRRDRIVAVGPTAEVQVPPGAQRIDGRGKFLMPGLGDMHVHSGQTDTTMFLYVANGVTTVRDLGMFTDTVLPRLRRQFAAGQPIVPRVYGPLRRCAAGSAHDLSTEQLADCFQAAKARGYDSYKIYGEPTADIAKLVTAAQRAGIRIVGHAPTTPGYGGIAKALAIPYWSIEHLWGYLDALLGVSDVWSAERGFLADYRNDRVLVDTAAWLKPGFRLDPARLRQIVEATRRAGAWNVPTLAILDTMLYEAAPAGPAVSILGRMAELNRVIVKALQDGGAGILLGSDYAVAPGFALHDELRAMVSAGLTPYQALAAGTRHVAEFLGTERDAGTVAVGKWADLLLLDGNPLVDVRNAAGPAGVMVGGRWLPRAAIDARLDSLGTYSFIDGAAPLDLQAERDRVWRHAGTP